MAWQHLRAEIVLEPGRAARDRGPVWRRPEGGRSGWRRSARRTAPGIARSWAGAGPCVRPRAVRPARRSPPGCAGQTESCGCRRRNRAPCRSRCRRLPRMRWSARCARSRPRTRWSPPGAPRAGCRRRRRPEPGSPRRWPARRLRRPARRPGASRARVRRRGLPAPARPDPSAARPARGRPADVGVFGVSRAMATARSAISVRASGRLSETATMAWRLPSSTRSPRSVLSDRSAFSRAPARMSTSTEPPRTAMVSAASAPPCARRPAWRDRAVRGIGSWSPLTAGIRLGGSPGTPAPQGQRRKTGPV